MALGGGYAAMVARQRVTDDDAVPEFEVAGS
jgi:hypothetical protein